MKSRSINFKPTNCQEATKPISANSLDNRRQQLRQWLHECRLATLALFEGVDDATFCRQAHPEFSPIGWHLGHIAYTESLWLLERGAGIPPLFPEYHRLFVADGLPKTERANLPPQGEVRHYLETIREQVLYCLETVELNRHERLWRWLIQHESQHSETIAFVLQLLGRGQGTLTQTFGSGVRREQGEQGRNSPRHRVTASPRPLPRPSPLTPHLSEMVEVPAGYFEQGNDSIDALDNERPVHQVYLETYWIDRCPVTCGQYRAFIEAGGYQNPSWWSDAGWRWFQDKRITQPLYWLDDSRWDIYPVCGVSWYEAEAYARFVGKRLPTEAEWEKAASWDAASERRRTYPWGEAAPDTYKCNHNNIVGQTTPVNIYPAGQSGYGCYDMLGNVWEWTASVFQGYEGFMPYPYAGYSKVYFDGQHQVLKGGSWATHLWALRSSFRNWYHPGVRQILAGFRCASNGNH